MNSPVARESGKKVEIQPFWTPRFLALFAQNGICGKLEVHKPPLFNDLQFRRRMVPGVVSTRSLALTVETTLGRRGCKAQRLDAAALPAPLDGALGDVVGWTPTRALGSAPMQRGWTPHVAPWGGAGKTRAAGRSAIRSRIAAMRPGNSRTVTLHGTTVSRPRPAHARAAVSQGPHPARLRPPGSPGTDTNSGELPVAPGRGKRRIPG